MKTTGTRANDSDVAAIGPFAPSENTTAEDDPIETSDDEDPAASKARETASQKAKGNERAPVYVPLFKVAHAGATTSKSKADDFHRASSIPVRSLSLLLSIARI